MALGHLIGGIAAAVQSSDGHQERLIQSVKSANLAVHAKFRGNGGSTLAAILASSTGQAYWLSVGDSRVYLAQGSKLTQLSVDDTIAGQLGKPGGADPDQSKLLQFIGIGEPLEPHIGQFDFAAGGSLLLTSDGVHCLAPTPNWLGLIVMHASDPGASVQRLVELSKWCGRPDNASAAMITWKTGAWEGPTFPYSCVEVWDPFGELQVIAEVARPVAAAPSPESTAPARRYEGEGKAAGAQAESGKQRRTRGSRKGKRAEPKAPAEAGDRRDAEVPQLVIEFPNKTE
jgi:serine/threonine protein phosphatase PrpC